MELKFIIESLLFTSQKPLSPAEIRDYLNKAAGEEGAEESTRGFKKTPIENIEEGLKQLADEHAAAGRSYRLLCVAGSWQFVTQPEFAPWLRALLGVKNRPARLSQPALETLAIIAYRQPITRVEVEQIRGVAADGVIATLKERALIEEAGRAEAVGRPVQFATTPAFLEYFGLASIEELPAADELRRIPVQKPEALLTVDHGLATTPPDALAATPAGEPSPTGETPPVEVQPPEEPELGAVNSDLKDAPIEHPEKGGETPQAPTEPA